MDTEDEINKVCELLDETSRSWNKVKMEKYLHQENIREIVKIPLSQFPHEDIMAWHYHKKGIFTMKSAYFLDVWEDLDVGSS